MMFCTAGRLVKIRRTRSTPVLLLALAALALPGTALASDTQESTFQDDNLLVFSPPAEVANTMDRLRELGVDRLRISVFWGTVAPDAKEQTKPDGFDGADPGAYPPDAWDRYDTIVRLAAERGLLVNFNLTSPAPYWATDSLPDRPDLDKNFNPDPVEFSRFAEAVGRRYSGGYVPAKGGRGLPRVSYWTAWNEPNQPGWLTPQSVADAAASGRFIPTAPQLYRLLVDGMGAGLRASGHATDVFLVGETAPKGQKDAEGPTRAIKPGIFIRELFCLDENLQFYRGRDAEVRDCPTSDQAASFVAAHPSLFKASGYAHHPYELTFNPTKKPSTDDFTTGNLNELSDLLRRVYARYGVGVPGGKRDVPLYLTEYGYQTDPPDPVGVSPATQAAYLNEAEFLTYRNRRVRTLSQFLYKDDLPDDTQSDPIAAFGATFQSGLATSDGVPKQGAVLAYRMPIFLPSRKVRRGSRMRVWGLVRPATNNKRTRVEIQLRTRKGSYKRAKTVTASRGRAYVDTKLTPRSSGAVRLVWKDGTGQKLTSRSISFRVLAPKKKSKKRSTKRR